MRLLPVSVVRPLFLGLAILSCAPERAISPTLTLGAFRADVSATAASTSTVVISQVYGGGGNAGATFKNDFIELFNRSADTVSLADWSVQYASSTGAFTQKTDLSGKIPPGGYLLVQEAAGAGGSVDLPTPEFTGAIAMAAGSGKVALARIKTLLGCGSAALPCNAAARANMADLVGYGSAANLFEGIGPTTPTLVNTTAAFRKGNGCIDTDENADDFVVGSPFPQNSQTERTTCGEGSGQEPATVTVRVSWVTPGTTFKVTATAVGNDGRPASPNYTWTSDPTTIATIESATGVAKGISLGVARVTATAPNGVSGSAPLFVVNPGDVASVSVSVNDPKQVPVGFTKPAFPTSRTTTGATVTPELTWSSSDEGIATVSSLGYITGVSAGSAKIRATAPDGVYGEVDFAVIPATAPSTANYGNALEFGTPTDGTPGDEFILTKRQYTESYNSSRGGPNWVSWKINASHFGDAPRCDCFSADQTLPSAFYHVVDFDYRNSGYDRGHVVQSESRTTTDQENASTFLLTNILPQGAENNQGPWSQFENYLNDLARGTAANPTRHEIYVIAGGRYGSNPGTLKDEGKVAIPDYTWKVAVIMDEGKGLADVHLAGDLQVIAIEMPNLTTPGGPASSVGIRNNPWQQYKKTVDEIEAQTGYDVLSALPDRIELLVESGDRPPVAVPGSATTAVEGSSVSFDGSGSSDPDGDALTYAWDFGDGTAGSSAAATTHTYADNGSYTATLTVKDPVGADDSQTRLVTVTNATPVVKTLTAPATVLSGETVFALATFGDAGVSDAPWSYVFDWGSGSASTGSTGDQNSAVGSSRSFLAPGTYSVGFTVTDKDLATSVKKVTTFKVLPISGAMSVNPQRININGQGNGQVIVTLFGSNAIDVATVNVGSVRIGAVGIDTNGNDGFKSSLKDENNDGIQDLVLHFERRALVDDGQLAAGTTRLVLRAMLSDGRQIEARGTVIVGSKD